MTVGRSHFSLPCAFISSHGRSVPGKTCFVHRLRLTPGLALDLRTGWDVSDPAHRAKMWSHLQRETPILILGRWSGLGTRTRHMMWMIDVYRWQVSQGRFFVHQQSGKLLLNAALCEMKSVLVCRVDWFTTRVTQNVPSSAPGSWRRRRRRRQRWT